MVTHERGRREGGEEGGEEAEPRGVERTHVRVGAVEDGHGRRFVLCIHRHSEAPSEDVGRALAVHALALKALMQRGNLGLGGLRLRLEVLDQLLELCDILGGGHRDGEGIAGPSTTLTTEYLLGAAPELRETRVRDTRISPNSRD